MTFAPITGGAITQWQAEINSASSQTGVPPSILAALISVESAGNPYAQGSAGEVGLTQLTPATANYLGVNPNSPQQNILGGATYLSQLYNQYGSWSAALSAYNSGSPSSAAGSNYAQTVLGLAYPAGLSGTTAASGSAAQPAEPALGVNPASNPLLTTPAGNVGITGYGVATVLIVLLVAVGFFGLVREA